MIIYNRYSVKIAEYWFDEAIQNEKVDVIRFIQRTSPPTGKKHHEFYTILIDLNKDINIIFKEMNSSSRTSVRRASGKDNLVFENCKVENEIIEEFVNDYNKFAINKGIPKISLWRLNAYAATGRLDVTRVKSVDGDILSWMSYYKDKERARMLFGHSHFRESADAAYRNYVGRANRYLIWKNIVKFKEQGLSTYDLGGWYQGNYDSERLDINRFKEAFGGKIVKNYNQEIGITPKGILFIFFLNTRDRLNALRKIIRKLLRDISSNEEFKIW